MVKNLSVRKPGDAIPGTFIKEIRLRRGLTQDQFAQQLGVRGGKAVISAWENGNAPCEGPAAELILRVFGGDGTADLAVFASEIDARWNCVPNSTNWRQVLAVPVTPFEIDHATLVDLFPEVAIPARQHVHGFPFVAEGLPSNVYGMEAAGWGGAIPCERDRAPHYLWVLNRRGQFAYRERLWEEDPMSTTQGQLHLGSVMLLALASVFFIRRLIERCRIDASAQYTLRMEVEGVAGRGVVGPNLFAPMQVDVHDNPGRLARDNRLTGTTIVSAQDIRCAPIKVGLALTGDVVLPLRPDLAKDTQLRRILRYEVERDTKAPFTRFGFLAEFMEHPLFPRNNAGAAVV